MIAYFWLVATEVSAPIDAQSELDHLYSEIDRLKIELDWFKKSPGWDCHDASRLD